MNHRQAPVRQQSVWRKRIAGVVGFLLLIGAASIVNADDFFKGRSLQLMIGYSVGGGYDAYARLLGRYMGNHIPGSPVIVPQQMTGAGSLRAANYIYTAAAKDGTVFGTFSRNMGISPLVDKAEFDSRKFTWLGSITDDNVVCVTAKASPIKDWDDFLNKPSAFGGEGAGADPDIWTLFYKNVFDAKVRLVSGYPGTNDIVLAMERGEVDGLCGISWSTLKTRHQDWLTEHSVNIIVQAALKKEPDMASVPLVTDLATQPKQRQIASVLLSSLAMARPFAAPPDIPADRKAALIDAFDATMTDPEFLADAAKQSFDVRPVKSSAIDALLSQVYAIPKDVLAEASAAISK
jgi:tripartite-type tricarboxylate transporter receptor subunit TctC